MSAKSERELRFNSEFVCICTRLMICWNGVVCVLHGNGRGGFTSPQEGGGHVNPDNSHDCGHDHQHPWLKLIGNRLLFALLISYVICTLETQWIPVLSCPAPSHNSLFFLSRYPILVIN